MEKFLFSPGPVPVDWHIPITFSHRSSEFKRLYERVKEKLLTRFKLNSKEWNVLFIQGSGSSAVETVVSNINVDVYNLWIRTEGEFSERANNLRKSYGLDNWMGRDSIEYHVLFETGRSKYNEVVPVDESIFVIVDAVSALGYYNFPKDADIVIGSTAKILGGIPVMGLIFYKKDIVEIFNDTDNSDYLGMRTYIKYDSKSQTPHTSLIPQFISLDMALDNPITKKQIDKNCSALRGVNGLQLVGDCPSPVLTFKHPKTKRIIKELKDNNIEVYYNPSYMKDWFQVSMFNYKDEKVYEYLKEMIEGVLLVG